MKFDTDNTATALLNTAQNVAIQAMYGVPAIPVELYRLAARIKAAILTQVALGRWVKLGVHDPDDLLELGVTAVLGNTLVGEPPIKIEYDFKRTKKPYIVVETVKRG